MARISRDKDSWKAGGVLRRDIRHDASQPERPKDTTPGKRKKTSRWCKGKVGQAHVIEERNYWAEKGWDFMRSAPPFWLHVCAVCGKHVRYIRKKKGSR